MIVRILGAHNIESSKIGFASFLIDDVLAIDASALTSSLSLAEQQKLKAVLLTHQHYDHVRDVPALGMNFYMLGNTVTLYATHPVYEALAAHLLNDVIYPNFMEKPPEKPAIRFNIIEPGQSITIAGYEVLPLAVNHAVPTIGYQITSPDGKKVFITSDTGPGLAECWRQVAPQVLLIELTLKNKEEKFALQAGHLTPALLLKEMESFREIKGYLPKIVLTHLNPLDEKEIKAEISVVAKALKTKITFGREGMQINVQAGREDD
jgi:ribonuclease BN (tRNA processing enzyme)